MSKKIMKIKVFKRAKILQVQNSKIPENNPNKSNSTAKYLKPHRMSIKAHQRVKSGIIFIRWPLMNHWSNILKSMA